VMSARTVQLPQSLSCIDYDQHHSLFVLAADSNVSFSSNSYSGMPSLFSTATPDTGCQFCTV